jgi:hypothetical protein
MAHIHQLVRALGEDLVWRAALWRGWRIINVRLGPSVPMMPLDRRKGREAALG